MLHQLLINVKEKTEKNLWIKCKYGVRALVTRFIHRHLVLWIFGSKSFDPLPHLPLVRHCNPSDSSTTAHGHHLGEPGNKRHFHQPDFAQNSKRKLNVVWSGHWILQPFTPSSGSASCLKQLKGRRNLTFYIQCLTISQFFSN